MSGVSNGCFKVNITCTNTNVFRNVLILRNNQGVTTINIHMYLQKISVDISHDDKIAFFSDII